MIKSDILKMEAFGDNVIIELLEQKEEKAASGLILAEPKKLDNLVEGLVLSVGEGKYVKGEWNPTKVKKGQKVWFLRYGGEEMVLDKISYYIVKEQYIIGMRPNKK